MRKAVVEGATGKVVNIIEIKPKANWTPPDGCILVDKQPAGNIGDIWDGEKFIEGVEEPVEVARDLAAEITALNERVKIIEDKVK